MALFDAKDPSVEILFYDTQGTPPRAKEVMKEALKENPSLIVGPVFSSEVALSHSLAQKEGINIISLSNNLQVADPNVFVMGFLPEEQIDHMISHARHSGQNRIVMLLPNDAYGEVIQKHIKNKSPHDFDKFEVILYNPEKINAPELFSKISSHEPDTLLIPQGGTTARTLISQLLYAGLDKHRVKIYGSDLWNDKEMLQEASSRGALFVTPSSGMHSTFIQKFKRFFTKIPHRISSLGYDAIAMAVALAKKTEEGFPIAKSDITSEQGFLGVDGPFRFKSNGKSQRQYSVFMITGKKPKMIQGAKGYFEE